MPFQLVKDIIADVASWQQPLQELVPVNYGEFMMYPHWVDTLDLCQQKLPKTGIVLPTNGSLLTEQTATTICSFRNVRLINFSINAVFPETYEAFMGLPYNNIERCQNALNQIRKMRPDIMLWVSMVHSPMYQTDNERDVFKALWSQYAHVQIINAASCGRPNHKVEIINKQPCRSLFSDMVIGFDRKITSCCFEPGFNLDLGYYEKSVLEAWRNPKLEELRKTHNEGNRASIKICKECSFA